MRTTVCAGKLQPMREGPLMRGFMARAAYEFPEIRIFRRNVGVLQVQDRIFRSGIRGQCDMYAYMKCGRVIEIEVKAAGGRLTPDQEHWRDWCRGWGIPWVLLQAEASELPARTLNRWVAQVHELLRDIYLMMKTCDATPTHPATPSAKEHFSKAREIAKKSGE